MQESTSKKYGTVQDWKSDKYEHSEIAFLRSPDLASAKNLPSGGRVFKSKPVIMSYISQSTKSHKPRPGKSYLSQKFKRLNSKCGRGRDNRNLLGTTKVSYLHPN